MNKKIPCAHIDPDIIKKAVQSFPRSWIQYNLSELIIEGSSRMNWPSLKLKKGQGGVYAFLFDRNIFDKSRYTIRLFGPRKNGVVSKIEFSFSVKEFPEIVDSSKFVAYVGKCTNFSQRLRLHLQARDGSTTFQVGNALITMGLVSNYAQSKEFILKHSAVHFFELHGPENAVNRDIIESTLYSKYHAPFNLKSER